MPNGKAYGTVQDFCFVCEIKHPSEDEKNYYKMGLMISKRFSVLSGVILQM